MVAVVAGNGLGLFNTSLNTLGGGGVLGQGGFGQAGGQALVNAQSGNLVLQFTDRQLSGLGLDLLHTRTYNTQGTYNDADGDGWRWDGERRVVLNGELNAAGSSVLRTTGDGHETLYRWNGSTYQSSDGDGAHDSLSWDADSSEWVWTDGSRRTVERYEGASGRLVQVTDASGTRIDYSYDTTGRLSSVKDASGQELVLVYNATGQLERLDTRAITGGVLTQQVYYSYDAQGRLASVTTDLTPADNSITDGQVYTTTYTYDGASFRIASVSQSDGTAVSFTYELVDGEYRVKTVTDASGTTTFSYDTGNRRTDITNGVNQQWSYFYDSEGRLLEVQTPAVNGQRLSTRYAYDADGNVSQITDGRGNAITYSYDANGNRVLERDALGNTLRRVYGAANQLLNEIRYTQPATWDSATGSWIEPPASSAQVLRYAYDSSNRLRYLVSATGVVSEYRYNGLGLRTQEVVYGDVRYSLTGLAEADGLSEAQLSTWAAARNKSQTSLTELSYDYRGNLTRNTRYAAVSAAGAGILNAATTVTEYIYSERGELLQTIAVRGTDRTAKTTLSSFVYDGLGRLLSQVDGSGTRTYAYNGVARSVAVSNSAGLTQTQVFDAQGRLLTLTESGTGVATRSTQYRYDAAGRLRMVQDATGVRSYTFYDEAGRVSAQVDGSGAVTESIYNATGQKTREVRYATLASTSTWYSSGVFTKSLVSEIRPTFNAATDRTTNYAYDEAGRLSSSTDAQGYVTTYSYDGRGQLIQIQNGDRITRTFYDADGRTAGVLDAEGYLRENVYDAAGRLSRSVRYAIATTSTLRATGTLAQLRPASTGALQAYYFYDAAGRQIGSVDEQQFVSETVYEDAGNRQQTIRYATVYTAAVGSDFAVIRAAVAAGAKQTSTTVYDGFGRVSQRIAIDGTVTAYEYDSAGRLVREIRAQGTSEERSTRWRYDVLGQTLGMLTGEGAVRITAGMSEAQIQGIYADYGLTYAYDVAGRQLSVTDAAGNKIVSYYDAAGRLTHTINKLGEVTETAYNAFGDVLEQTRFIDRLSSATTAGLTGGLLTTPLSALTQAMRDNAANSSTNHTYDLRGQRISSTDALGYLTTYGYNRYGEQASLIRTITQGATPTTTRTNFGYNKRGELVGQTEDVGGLARYTTTQYDAFGRVISRTDGRGLTSTTRYDSNGRVVVSSNPLSQSESTEYDAFARVFKQTDALGRVTSYSYDDANRTLTQTLPGNVQVVTTRNRHGETLSLQDGNGNITRYSYDKNGRLLTSTNALSQITTHTYDASSGFKTSVTDAAGNVTRYSYDETGRTLTVTDALNVVTRYAYDGLGRKIRVTEAEGNAAQRITDYLYDAKDQLLQVIQDPAGLKLSTTYAYDGLGRQLQVSRGTVAAPNQQVTRYEFDNLGRRTAEVVDPDGLQLRTEYRYNKNDQVTRKIDAAGNSTWYIYDSASRLSDTIDSLGGVTRNSYDSAGRATSTRQYTTLLSAETLASLGDTPASVSSTTSVFDRVTDYVYDAVGRLRFTVDAEGYVSERSYDALGNLKEEVRYTNKLQGARDQATLQQLFVNRLGNATFASPDSNGVPSGWALGISGDGTARTNVNLGSWTAQGLAAGDNTVYLVQTGRTEEASYQQLTQNIAQDVIAGQRYAFSAYTGAHRATVSVHIIWRDAQGAILGWTTEDAASRNANEKGGGASLSGYKRIVAQGVAPVGAVKAQVVLRKNNTNAGYTDSYLFAVHAQFEALEATDSTPSDWAPVQDAATTRYAYDALGRIQRSTDAAGKSESYTYDAVGNRKTLTNKNGAVWTYNYDSLNRLVEEISPPLYVADIDDNGTVTATTYRAVTLLTYDAAGNVTSRQEGRLRLNVADPASSDNLGQARTTSYTYDKLNRQITITSPGWYNKTTGTFQQAGDGTTNTFQVVTTVTYDAAGNAVRNRVRVNNTGTAATDYVDSFKVYDVLGRVTHEIDALKGVTTYTYDSVGNPITTKRYANALTAALPSRGYYLASDITSSTLVADATMDRTLTSAYDKAGRKVSVQQDLVSIYTFTGSVASSTLATLAPTTVYTYDALGRVIKETQIGRRADGTTQITGASTTYYYDKAGNRIGMVNAMGYYTRMEYDGLGRLTRQVEYSTALTSWTHTAIPTSPASTDDDRSTLYSYDAMGRLIQTTRENVRYWVQDATDFGGLVTSSEVRGNLVESKTTYDNVGNIKTITDALGNVTTSEYNALGQVTKVIEPERWTAKNVTDPFALGFGGIVLASPTTTYLLNAFGQIIREVKAAGKDEAGNVQQGLTQTTRTQYDDAGYEIKSIDATNAVETYKVDVAGRRIEELQKVDITLNAWTWVDGNKFRFQQDIKRNFEYDKLGQQTATITWYGDWDWQTKAAKESVEYNRFGEITAKRMNGALLALYNYDQVGHITSSADMQQWIVVRDYDLAGNATRSNQIGELWGSAGDDRITYTKYDALGRAVEQHLPAFSANTSADTLNNVTLTKVTPVIKQAYDRWGNVASRIDARGNGTLYSYDHNNRLFVETSAATDILRENGTSYRANLMQIRQYDAVGKQIAEQDWVWPYAGQTNFTLLRTRHHVYNQVGDLNRDVDALGYTRSYLTDVHGNRVATKDAVGVVTVDSYDAMDRHTLHGIMRNGTRTTLLTNRYDQAGRLVAETTGSTEVEETLTSTANTSNWTSTTSGVKGNTRYTLRDALGNVQWFLNESRILVRYGYDAYSRKINEWDALGGNQSWTYTVGDWSKLSSRKDLGGHVFTYSYNLFEQIASETSSGSDKFYYYFENGLLQSTVVGSITKDAAGTVTAEDTRTTSYAYDAAGNRVREVNAGRYYKAGVISQSASNETRSAFDERGRLDSIKTPAGTQLVGSLGTQYTSVNTAFIDVLRYSYDEFGNRRNVFMSTADQSGKHTMLDDWYTYDLEGRVLKYGQFWNLASTGSRRDYFDSHGGKIESTYWTGTNNDDTPPISDNLRDGFTITYDAAGRRQSMQSFREDVWQYRYNAKNNDSIWYYEGHLEELESYSYNDLNQLVGVTSRQLAYADFNTSPSAIAYREYAAYGPVVQKYTAVYDGLGNKSSHRTYKFKIGESTKSSNSLITYTYRGDGQLASQLTYNMDSSQRLSQANYFDEDGMIDAAGNQKAYRYVVYKSDGGISYRGNYSTTHAAYDTYKEVKTTATWTKSGSAGTTTNTYTDRGELLRVDVTGAQTYTRHLASNRDGQLTTVKEKTGVQSHVYHGGREVANAGNANAPEITDTIEMVTRNAYDPAPASHVVSEGDTLQSIALQVWGDDAMWYLIADANGLVADDVLTVGDTLKIPNVLGSTHNDANDFKPYDPRDVIGNTTPSPKPPKPKKKKKSGGLSSVVMVVVAIVATIYTAGAAGGYFAAAGTAATSASTAAVGAGVMVGGSAATVGISTGALIGSAMIGGAVGAAAGQLAGMAMGVVDSFSWSQVAAGGLTAGLTAGVGVAAQAGTFGSGMQAAAEGMLRNNSVGYSSYGVFNYASNQAINRVVGLDTSFSWRGMAASVLGSNLGGYIGGSSALQNLPGLSRGIVSGQASAFASAHLNDKWFGGGRPDYGQVAVDAFGNTLVAFVRDQMGKSALEAETRKAMDAAGVEYWVNDNGELETPSPFTKSAIENLARSGASSGEIAKLLNGDMRSTLLTQAEVLADGRVAYHYESGAVSYSAPAEQALVSSLSMELGGTGAALVLQPIAISAVTDAGSASPIVQMANTVLPPINDAQLALGAYANQHPTATRLLGYAAQGAMYAIAGPAAAVKDVLVANTLGPYLEQGQQYAEGKLSAFYQEKGVRADAAPMAASGTFFAASMVLGRVSQGIVAATHAYKRSVVANNETAAASASEGLPNWLKARFEAGNEFNRVNRARYPYNEVEVVDAAGRKFRVDSYDPIAGEIVSRKYTQLGEIKPETGIGYLQELARKYPDGAVISNSPFNSRVLQGQRLMGDLILEVPAQKIPIPKEVLDYATKQGMVIRDVNGVIH